MTNADRILSTLRAASKPLDDDELARRSGVRPRQQVNQICRRLEAEGRLDRNTGASGKIVNTLTAASEGSGAMADPPPGRHVPATGRIARQGAPERSSSDSSSVEQRAAERVMLDLLEQRLGVALEPRRLPHPGGGYVEVDGASADLRIIVECWAHQGRARVGQKHKLVNDATKLSWIAKSLAFEPERLILCVSDEKAVAHLRGKSWQGSAIRDLGVHIEVVSIPGALIDTLVAAQKRQYR